MPDLKDFLRSRLPVFAAIAVVTILLSAGIHIRGNVPDAWRMMHVPAVAPTFSDTLMITEAIDCLLHGQDPYFVRDYDPLRRVYNYPPIWLDLRYLGVTSRTTNVVGIVFACMALAALLILFRAKRKISAAVVFLSLLCRPLLVAIERGNCDLVIFSLLVFGFFLIERQSEKIRSAATGALLVVLTVLKIYPVVAVSVLARTRRSILTALLTGVVAIGALVLTAGHRLSLVRANTPQNTMFSFGAYPFFLAMAEHTMKGMVPKIMDHHAIAAMGAMLIAVVSICFGWKFRDRLDRFLPRLEFSSARGCIAISGLAIFCFTFLRGASYSYRLIFLFGVVAYLVDDLNRRRSMRSLPACICLLIFFGTQTLYLHFTTEVFDGLTFAVACAWLGTTLLSAWLTPSKSSLEAGVAPAMLTQE